MCKSDLDEILNRLKSQMKSETLEDQLRKELLDQSKKMNELKAVQERQVYELSNENFQKIDKLQQKWEADRKAAVQKLKDDIGLKNERIRELEKNEKRLLSEKEKSESMQKQLRELQERLKSLQTDRDMLEQDKKYLDENVKKQDERVLDLEYQLKKFK